MGWGQASWMTLTLVTRWMVAIYRDGKEHGGQIERLVGSGRQIWSLES